MAGSFGPSLAALVLALREGSLRTLLGGLTRRAPILWWLAATLFLPALALGLALTLPGWPVPPAMVLALPLFMVTHALANPAPFGEELGWRGYALPRLLTLMPPVRAALLLGAVGIVWHLPAFLLPGAMAAGIAGFGWWALAALAHSVVMTWLYLRANGNVLVAGVVPHWIVDGAGAAGVWASRPAEALALAALATILAAAGGLRRLA
jgi:membrane protease YdiL (CAAX protease family)